MHFSRSSSPLITFALNHLRLSRTHNFRSPQDTTTTSYYPTMGPKVAIIGGSGFYSLEGLTDVKEVYVETEFGPASDAIVTGKIGGVDCVVLARHGRGHHLNPTEVNYRANIRALDKLGVTHILAATACGSLREEMKPGDLCILDSFIDRTTKRHQTFHDQGSGANFGTVCHIPMADPFCQATRQLVLKAAKDLGLSIHEKGTMVTIEGPRFSSRAESMMFKSWGADLINMTLVPEVVLAAEAGISYVSVAMVTDYDCWKSTGEAVNVENVLKVLRLNIENVKKLFVKSIMALENNQDWRAIYEKNKMQAQKSVMAK